MIENKDIWKQTNLHDSLIADYFNQLENFVYKKISVEINNKTINQIISGCLKFHIDDKKSADFQKYYFLTVENEEEFFNRPDFFRKFKKQYSLQGINNSFLDSLETKKKEIMRYINKDKLINLYFDKFYQIKIKQKSGIVTKDLNSFFAKLVHTFRPADYCALDNPIKKYFGLNNESFIISFFIISRVYKTWAIDNKKSIEIIRKGFREIDRDGIMNHEKITDLKLLDLIFWKKANIK